MLSTSLTSSLAHFKRYCYRLSMRSAFRSAATSIAKTQTRNRAFSSSINSNENEPRVLLTFHNDYSLAKLTLHNPTRRNALTYKMMEQLDRHVYTLDKWSRSGIIINEDLGSGIDVVENHLTENNARVVLLTGSGGNFCSGLDLHDHEKINNLNGSEIQSLKEGVNMTKHMARLTNHLLSLPILSISAIDGFAIGGGAELTTCTDLVVMSRDAKVQFVHAKRGASMGWGGGRRLVKKVGRSRALKMLLLGESVKGEEEARRLEYDGGISMYADFVANKGEAALDAAMRRFVNPLMELPCSQSIRAIKAVVSAGEGDRDVIDPTSGVLRLDSNEALRGEMESFVSVWGGDSNKEQIQQAKDRLKEKKTT